jgi:hypothetical protein
MAPEVRRKKLRIVAVRWSQMALRVSCGAVPFWSLSAQSGHWQALARDASVAIDLSRPNRDVRFPPLLGAKRTWPFMTTRLVFSLVQVLGWPRSNGREECEPGRCGREDDF